MQVSEVDKSLHVSYCSLAYKLPPNDRHLLATRVLDVIHHINENNQFETRILSEVGKSNK